MSAYIFVVVASYNVLKPMTRSLFVSNLGLEQLPVLYMVLALVAGVFVALYLRISRRLKLDLLIKSSTLFLIATLLGQRWLLSLQIDSPVLYYVLFIWASIYGVLTTTQFWLLTNYVFNVREAKRIFPILTASGLLGGILGGYCTRILVTVLGGTSNLAFFCVGLLSVAFVLIDQAWKNRDISLETARRGQASQDASRSVGLSGDMFASIRGSRHVLCLVAIVALTYMAVQIADFQFIAFASRQMSDTDSLTGFLGFWLSNLSIAALLFQVVFANTILQRFGVGMTILFLPVALALSSTWVFLGFGLTSILALKVGDGAFRHSINKVGIELLFLPVPTELKRKAKGFIDMFVDRFARGLAGLVLLVFYTGLGFTISEISLLVLGITIVWIGLAIVINKEYVNSFRLAIAKRRIDYDEIPVSIKDEATINSLLLSLASRNERQVVYALRILTSVQGVDLKPPLEPLLRHKSANVRYHTLQAVYAHKLKGLLPSVQPLIRDENTDVRREAVSFYVEFSEQAPETLIRKGLAADDRHLRGGTLQYVASQPHLAKHYITPEVLETFLQGDCSSRTEAAQALGHPGISNAKAYLRQLLQDPDQTVRQTAVASIGQIHAAEFLPDLVESLADRSLRKAARAALANLGEEILPELVATLSDQKVAPAVRMEIPRSLALLGTQESVEALLEKLDGADDTLRYRIIKALNRLRTNYSDLKFDTRVDRVLLEETKMYYQTLAYFHLAESTNSQQERDGRNLLQRSLQERLDDHLERIFRLLGLRYPPKDIYNAFAATTSATRSVRVNAVEFLDNTLSKDHKSLLLPVVDDLPIDQVLQKADGLIDVNVRTQKDLILDLLKGNDSWLQACALYQTWVCGLTEELRDEVVAAQQAKDAIVRETAGLVLERSANQADEA